MIVFTATEIADAIGVNPKAFRSFVRSMVRANGGKVGENTPGSGGRYRFECNDDDVEAFVARWAAAYRSHARTNNTRAITLESLIGADDAIDEGDADA